MPSFRSIKRRDFIKALQKAGFEGPYSGGKHQYMIKGTLRLVIPNPHRKEISSALLARILRQAGISRAQWEQL